MGVRLNRGEVELEDDAGERGGNVMRSLVESNAIHKGGSAGCTMNVGPSTSIPLSG